jgi:hypothetical protein
MFRKTFSVYQDFWVLLAERGGMGVDDLRCFVDEPVSGVEVEALIVGEHHELAEMVEHSYYP